MRIIETVTFCAERNDIIGIFAICGSHILVTLTEWDSDRVPFEFRWVIGEVPEKIVEFARELIDISPKGKAWEKSWLVGER